MSRGATKPSVLIIGAGIAGLSAALALSRRDFAVRVFEQAKELRPLGAGLSLWSNAMLCLRDLGIAHRLVEAGSLIQRLQFRTQAGDLLQDLPIDRLSDKLGAPTICVHRADLQRVLLESLGPGFVDLGTEFSHYVTSDRGITAHFADDSTVSGDLLIGADGIDSRVRAQLIHDGPPRYAGYGASLGVAEFDHKGLAPGLAFESWGIGVRFGCWPCGAGRVYWYFSANRAEPFDGVVRGRKADLLNRVAGWHEPIQAILEATDEEKILHVSSFDRDPVRSWSGDRVTLAGDAAHPMTPNLGQGACQAIEDALTLARSLEEAPDVTAGLRICERLRVKRASRLVREARGFGGFAQTENRLVCWLWRSAVGLMPTGFILRQMTSQIRGPC